MIQFYQQNIIKKKSSIHISITEDYADITISKDIVSDKDNKDSINITLGDPYTCKNYIQLSTFYNRLAKLSKGVLKDEEMKKNPENKINITKGRFLSIFNYLLKNYCNLL